VISRPTGGVKRSNKTKMTVDEVKEFKEKVKQDYEKLCSTL
jgi:hypothetical protein